MSIKPDYSKYTLSELHDVEQHIDKYTYPERYQEVLNQIAERTNKKTQVQTRKTLSNLILDEAEKQLSQVLDSTDDISDNYSWDMLDPLSPDKIEKGSISKDKIAEVFSCFPWEELLLKLESAQEKDIFYSPSLTFRDKSLGCAITFTVVRENTGYIFYVFFERPEERELSYTSDILDQSTEDSVRLLQLFTSGDFEQLRKIF